jgi:hypothetical protein
MLATAARALVICADMALPGLRYSKIALLVFGAGLALGLAVVAAKLPSLARVASLAMAAGIIALPFAAAADWRRRTLRPKPAARGRGPAAAKRRVPSTRRRAARRR